MNKQFFLTMFFCLQFVLWYNPYQAQSQIPENKNSSVKVPEIRGLEVKFAKQIARVAELNLVNGTYYISPEKWSSELQPNIIYIQSIPANKNIPVGTEIGTWRLGKATESQKLITVPNFRGINITDAIETCKKNNLTINQKFIDQSAVVDHFPKKGSKVYEGTFIFFTTQQLSSDKNK